MLKFFIASRRMYASSKRQFIHIQKLSSIGFPSTVSSFSRKWVPNQDTLTLYPQSGSQTTCHSANSIKVPHWILRITFCYIIIVNHLVSLSWQKPKVPAGRLDWQISLPTKPMNLWIIGPSKSPQNVEAEHLEELNMKCPTRTSVSRSWNLKVDKVIEMTEILGSFSQPTKHKRCGSTFRLVVAWSRLVFFWGGMVQNWVANGIQ